MENRVVYLIRHGKIQQEDDQRRYIGQIDLPLTEEGIKQAQVYKRGLNAPISGPSVAVTCRGRFKPQRSSQVPEIYRLWFARIYGKSAWVSGRAAPSAI
jgi:bisphosphoglycerate-dependent phosphoglycerate mutase